MEPLAFVEIVDRHGDVLARHAVQRWPLSIGRSYRADVIVDDPFVAALHASIDPAGDDRFRITSLDATNGIVMSVPERRVEAAEIGGDDVVRLGHTWLRVRSPSYQVPPERALRAIGIHHSPLGFAVVAAVTLAFVGLNAWVAVNDESERYGLLFGVLAFVAVLAGWIGLWSFVSYVTQRRLNFFAHAFVACAGITALGVAGTMFDYLTFGLDAGWLEYPSYAAITAAFGYMLYRHLLLNSRARRRALTVVASAVSVGLFVLTGVIDWAMQSVLEGQQRFNGMIKPPAFLWVSGVSTEGFMGEAAKLKNKVDALAKKK